MPTAQQPQAIVRVNPDAVPIALAVFGHERLALLKEQIGRGWPEPMTDAELEHIGMVCQRTRLDPLVKPPQIYFIKRKDSKLGKYVMTPQVSIDGLRLTAQRSRAYGGATPYLYCGPDGQWKEFWDADEPPVAAKVGVKRRGWPDWLWATATWKEWAQYEPIWEEGSRQPVGKRLAQFWAAKPAHMLGKTAEAIALKRAFPEETNELELASIDAEWHEQVRADAQRYTEIFGSEETRTAYDMKPQRALNGAGELVDTQTGELLQPSEDASRAHGAVEQAHSLRKEDRPPTSSPKQGKEAASEPQPVSSTDMPAGAPDRVDRWAENRRLVDEARKRGIEGKTLNAHSAQDVVEAANAELAARIRAYDAGAAEQAEF